MSKIYKTEKDTIDITKVEETYQTALLNEQVWACKKCDICSSKKYKPGYDIASRVNRAIDILFIKEMPTFDEMEIGAPFTSAPGLFFRGVINVLDRFGASIGFANLVHCIPSSYTEGQIIRPPTEEEVLNCSEHLVRFLQIHKPKTIVCLGKVAAKYVPAIVEEADCSAVIRNVVHPAFIIKNGGIYALEYDGWKEELQFIFMLHQRRLNETKTV